MKKSAIAAVAVAALAFVLSSVALMAASGGDDSSEALDAASDAKRDASIDRLAEQISAIETRIEELAAAQTELAARAEALAARPAKVATPSSIDPARLNTMVDERVRMAVALASGKARMKPDELPEAVMVAAIKALEGAQIARAELRHKNGRSEYRLKAKLDGKSYDLRITPEGEIIEAEMPPDRAPQVVKDAAAKAAAGINLRQVKLEMDKEEGRQVYDVEGRIGDDKYDIIIAPDGQVIEVDGPDGKIRFDTKPAGATKPTEAF